MSFPRYLEYKASGVEWLGEVPGHWDVYKLQDLAKSERYSFVDGPFGSDLKNDEYTESGIPLIQLNNINEGAHVLNSIKYVSPEKADQLGRHNAFPGDIAIAKMADPVARAAIVNDSFDRYVIVADCIRLSVEGNFAAPSFAVYAINSPYFRSHAIGLSSGITRLRINLGALKQIRLALPHLGEQTQIAAFLDRETAKIDALVAEQRRLMALLKEKRQAVISHAVTRGLNPDAPMKPSGIEWLGDVPAHWAVKRLKHVSPFITVGVVVNPSTFVSDEGYPFIYGGDIREGVIDWANSRRISSESSEANSKTRLKSGDLLTVRVGAPGITAVVPAECDGGNCASVMLVRQGNFNSHWLCFAMNTRIVRFQVEVVQYGAAQEQFNISHAINFWTPTPPRSEQDEIAEFLAAESLRFDTLTTEAQRAIDLLQERRTALISAAVTGQIDVRGAVIA